MVLTVVLLSVTSQQREVVLDHLLVYVHAPLCLALHLGEIDWLLDHVEVAGCVFDLDFLVEDPVSVLCNACVDDVFNDLVEQIGMRLVAPPLESLLLSRVFARVLSILAALTLLRGLQSERRFFLVFALASAGRLDFAVRSLVVLRSP